MPKSTVTSGASHEPGREPDGWPVPDPELAAYQEASNELHYAEAAEEPVAAVEAAEEPEAAAEVSEPAPEPEAEPEPVKPKAAPSLAGKKAADG